MNRRIREALARRPSHRLVADDPFRIAERLKDIEEGYFILRNTNTGRYEVHSTMNLGSTYCFTVPFDRLDSRTLEYCRETSTGRNGVELAERQNARLEASRERSRRDDMRARTEEVADRMLHAKGSYKRVFTM